MSQSPREIVKRCLIFDYPERIPRDLWLLPWASIHHPKTVSELNRRFPGDIITAECEYQPSRRVKGDPHKVGYYTDEWDCTFRNIQEGIIGEIATPLIPEIENWMETRPPYETLPSSRTQALSEVNSFCSDTDRFVLAKCCPRPWERYQFLRGTENALVDVLMPGSGFRDLLKTIHDYYLTEFEFWASTDVDGMMFMDDWGAQDRLLIPPDTWRELFKPLYRDYCRIAKSKRKFTFMHSDGYIADIMEDLVEIGVDAINSQLFCMDIKDLAARLKGRISFWGEIDRQQVLPCADPQAGIDAVQLVASHLYDPSGGIIAQFEFGPGANPETALAIFEEWERVASG